MALQAGVLPSRQEQGRAGNKQSWKELVMTAAATRNVKLHGSAEILSPVNIYSYEITLSGKEKKKSQ